MRTVNLKVKLLEPTEIIDGLDPAYHPQRLAAEDALGKALAARDAGKQAVLALSRRVEALPTEIATGRSAPRELELALRDRQTAALQMGPLEQQVVDAEKALAQAQGAARKTALQEADKRRDQLQQIADLLTPVLEHLRDLEAELDAAVGRLGDPQRPEVQPVTWPSSLVDQFRAHNLQMSVSSVQTARR